MRRKTVCVLSLLLCLCVGLTGCTTYDNFRSAMTKPVKPEGIVLEPIRIGVYEPMTGDDSVGAADELEGIAIAHELFPEVLGRKVELIYADNQSDPANAAAAAQSLIDQGVCTVLGSYKNVLSLAAGDVFAAAEIPAIAATCTNPLITQTNDYYARVCYIDAFQGRSAAEYIASGLGQTKVSVLHQEGDDLAAAMIDEFRAEIASRVGSELIYNYVEYPADTTDYGPYLRRLASGGANCVFFPSSASSANAVLKAADEGGFAYTWVGTSQWEDILNGGTSTGAGALMQTITNAQDSDKSYLEGVAFVTEFDADAGLTTTTEQFLAAYREKHGQDASPSENVALGFDAYLLAITAIDAAKSDRIPEFIMRQITRVRDMAGASGLITMDAQGDPTRSVVIEMIIEGSPTAVYATAMRAPGEE